LFTEALRQVRSFIQERQLPFLNLSAESFRVSLADVGSSLPILWTAKCSLVKPGNAFELPVATSDFKYFIRPGSAGASIYLPEGISAHLQGTGSVRIRKVLPPEQGQTILEGTLVVQERLPVVDATVGRNRDDHVLIEKNRIVGRSFDRARGCKNLPRTRAQEIFAWHGGGS